MDLSATNCLALPRASLLALRAAHNPKRLICVFQPHQHSRTRFLLEQFATSFKSADDTEAINRLVALSRRYPTKVIITLRTKNNSRIAVAALRVRVSTSVPSPG